MSYDQQTWNNGDPGTPLSADRLAHIEAGIGNAQAAADASAVTANSASAAAAAAAPATRLVNGHPLTADVTVTKGDVGLGSVDNTSDASKPVSTATATALAAKAPIASPTFTGTVSGVTKSMVGLGNVDNTADAAKPVSTAQQAALDAKANSVDVPSALTDLSGTLDDSQQTAGVVMGRVFTSTNYTTLARLTSRTDMPFMWLGDATTDNTMVPTNSLSGDVILYNAA
jgi:hypothetical protein